jgi:hypothetical protein
VRSSHPNVCHQARWFSGQGLKHIPALLSCRRENRADDGEIPCAILGAESAGDLLAQFHHPPIPLRQIIGEGDGGIGQEAEHVLVSGAQA